jgi:anti-sigma-K factor RskA
LSNGPHIREEDLELYALGALSDQQAAEVCEHVSICSLCAPKLAESRGHAALLALGLDQEKPSPAAKEKLFARIAAERAANPAVTPPSTGAIPVTKKPATSWWNWVLVPATAALAILSVSLWRQNVQLYAELRNSQRVAADLEKERLHVQKLINVLSSPRTITVKLAGTSDGTQNSGIVRYDSASGLLVYTADLPALPADKVYQMWLVPITGAPLSAGTFLPPAPGQSHMFTAEISANAEPKAFAVTVEPAGGVPQPTGPKVLLGAT